LRIALLPGLPITSPTNSIRNSLSLTFYLA
jgi:hypothetical protein